MNEYQNMNDSEKELLNKIIEQIKNWNGETESELGKLLSDKFNEIRKKQMSVWD